MTHDDVVQALAAMITEVIGDDHLGIEAGTSFRDELGFQSIQFVALAELIQERWDDLDFATYTDERIDLSKARRVEPRAGVPHLGLPPQGPNPRRPLVESPPYEGPA